MLRFKALGALQKIAATLTAPAVVTYIFLSIFTANVHADNASSVVHLRGSTTLMPIAQMIAETYMNENPDASVVVSGGGTARGYKAILDGTADIAMASSVMPDDLLSGTRYQGIKLQNTLLGYATIVTVVHPSNPIQNLSLKQLKDVFTGRINNWKQLGGADAPIKVYVGPPTGGITDTWKHLILGEDDTYTPSGIVMSNDDRIKEILKYPTAITFLTLGSVHTNKLKILQINNVSPDASSVKDGRYLLRAPLILVTKESSSMATRNFINYFSAQERIPHIDGIVNIYSKD
jgi:phosphate transport system substrate-binding protein